ncbi:hypothetical protein K438DRAFT_2103525 [Mycena galopus ATCC 62051]|nr:hypothetical protein K438DRAFT_2103525 [Mycena galopus ATCC 62051]
MDSDEDADLALALALSPQEAEAEAAARKGYTSNKKAKATTKKQEASKPRAGELSKLKEEAVISKAGAGPLSFLGDRAQMERERLARQKRVCGPSPPPKSRSNSSANSNQDDEDDESDSEGSARKWVRLNPPSHNPTTTARTFPTGALLRIDTQHADSSIPNKPDCIRLSEVLGPKDEQSFAILSAFNADAPWLYGFFARDTPVVPVTDVNTSGTGAELGDDPTQKNIFPSWVRVCPLPTARGGYSGCMHMKFMLRFKKSGALRVVYLFIQDIPPAAPGTRTTPPAGVGEKPGETFPAILARVLRSVGVEEALAIMGRQGHTTLPLPILLPSALHSSFPAKHAKHAPKPSPLETNWDWCKDGPTAPHARAVSGQGEGRWEWQEREGKWVMELDCLERGVDWVSDILSFLYCYFDPTSWCWLANTTRIRFDPKTHTTRPTTCTTWLRSRGLATRLRPAPPTRDCDLRLARRVFDSHDDESPSPLTLHDPFDATDHSTTTRAARFRLHPPQ